MNSSLFHGNEFVDKCNVQYQNVTDVWRKITGSQGGVERCDRDRWDYIDGEYVFTNFNGNRWFRFVEPAGTKLSTSDPSGKSCGTEGVGWLEDFGYGAHPKKQVK